MPPVFWWAILLFRVEDWDAVRSVIEARGFDLGVQRASGYLSREYWARCAFRTGTEDYQGRVSARVVFASRVYSPEVKTSPSLSRYRIELRSM